MLAGQRKLSLVGLLQTAAILTVVVSFLSGIGVPHRNIELLSHFRLQYLIASILLLIVFAVSRNPIYAGALVVATVFNASFILPWYIGDTPEGAGASLRILHANVRSSNTNYQRLIDYIVLEDPDILFLQEVTPEWVDGTSGLLRAYPHVLVEPRRGSFGIAVYSKLALASMAHIDSPPCKHPTLIAKTTFNGKPLTLISTHPSIPLTRKLYESRNEQLLGVSELVNRSIGNVMLIGDLNASVWDPQYRKLEAATGLTNCRRGFGVLPSWPTYFPIGMIPIDHALVSDGIRVLDTRTGDRIGSDHLPLLVTVSM